MYCSLDKIDLAAMVDGRQVAMQTDHRSADEIEAEPELSALFAMTRVLNARSHSADDTPNIVHYIVSTEPPELLREALTAVGATLDRREAGTEPLGEASEERVGEIADRCFRKLALRAAARIGSRDLAIALRMLEDQTFADPPERTDEFAYWQRVLELAALTGELLRAKFPGRWVQTDRALVPFGFSLACGTGSTILFPTNRAQRVVEDGADESLFKLLLAAEETLQRPPDAATGRLMPSLRDRRNVELDEIVWDALLPEATHELPVVVCGIDGESTFGMIRREALDRTAEEAMATALANLADETVVIEEMHADDLRLVVVSESFYAAEKLLDQALMTKLHALLGAEVLAAAVPARGLLLVASAIPAQVARFAALVRARFDDAGGRAISPLVMLVEGGSVSGFVAEPRRASSRADTGRIRADTAPEVKVPGLLKRLLGRK
ncbi:MAG: hypothetical protein ABI867_02330 [Kofleriaceae bacterium]